MSTTESDTDTPGSLCDFIVNDSDYDEENDYVEEEPQEIAAAAAAFVAANLAPETTDPNGLRRSTRTRRRPEVYVDDNFAEVFFENNEEIEELMDPANEDVGPDDEEDEDYHTEEDDDNDDSDYS